MDAPIPQLTLPQARSRWDGRATWCAVALAGLLAALQYFTFLPHESSLWTDPVHDRNTHYLLGVQIAYDVRHGHIGGLFRDLNGARVWPPLHGLILGGILTVTGSETKFAVLPSVLAWAGLLVAAFAAARRISPTAGNLAGLIALLLAAASPSHRAFAVDAMLESLGTCLSLWAVERYLNLRGSSTKSAVRSFAVVLLGLFLTKYNYWALVCFGIAATEAVTRPGLWLKPRTLLRTPEARILIRWFIVPVIVWFCLPGRVGAFIWFGFIQAGEHPDADFGSRLGKCADWLLHDFHTNLFMFIVAAASAIYGAFQLRRKTVVILLFLSISAVLTIRHPNCKSRFLMSWLPALWVLSGVGVASLLGRRLWTQLTAAVIFAALCLPHAIELGCAQESGMRPSAPTLRRLSEITLPLMEADRRTAVFSTVPMKSFLQWSLLQHSGHIRDRELDAKGWLPLERDDLAGFVAWLDRARCDRVIVLRVERNSPFYAEVPGWHGDRLLADWREMNRDFEPVTEENVAEWAFTVTVFRRKP